MFGIVQPLCYGSKPNHYDALNINVLLYSLTKMIIGLVRARKAYKLERAMFRTRPEKAGLSLQKLSTNGTGAHGLSISNSYWNTLY